MQEAFEHGEVLFDWRGTLQWELHWHRQAGVCAAREDDQSLHFRGVARAEGRRLEGGARPWERLAPSFPQVLAAADARLTRDGAGEGRSAAQCTDIDGRACADLGRVGAGNGWLSITGGRAAALRRRGAR